MRSPLSTFKRVPSIWQAQRAVRPSRTRRLCTTFVLRACRVASAPARVVSNTITSTLPLRTRGAPLALICGLFCVLNRKALSVNTLQPTNLLARAMSGTTRVCARCRAARLRGSEHALHAHQIEDTTHAPSDPHIPLDPVERCRLFTLYIDSNDTELLPIRCSTLNSIFLGTRSPSSPWTSPNAKALDRQYTAPRAVVGSGGATAERGGWGGARVATKIVLFTI
ncbi:hypothetical protein B0H11DRAFT_2289090 [Mycena galericulata]|nr:hypothetical protein B0H11DRAFT_2289090 [Mycena galericulata]